jgi:cytochrome P450
MRLYPTGWIMGRRAITDCIIGEYHIPKDTFVLMSQWTMHRSDRWFSDPLRFDPDRWNGGLDDSLPKFVFFPFGGGPHKCIGDSFATMEVTLVLATIAQHYKLTLPADYRVEMVPRLTLRPKHGMPMIISKR